MGVMYVIGVRIWMQTIWKEIKYGLGSFVREDSYHRMSIIFKESWGSRSIFEVW